VRWRGERESEKVDDERQSGDGGRIAIGGGIGGIILVVVYLLLGGDLQSLLDTAQESQPPSATTRQVDPNAPKDEMSQFVAVVLADTEDAVGAASAVGDDNLQRQTQGYVVPDSFTHGTSAQRVRWFRKGYESGDINQGARSRGGMADAYGSGPYGETRGGSTPLVSKAGPSLLRAGLASV
jgi:predicted metalloprotease